MTFREAMREAREAYLREVIKKAGGSVVKAAALAGLNRSHFYVLLARAGISPPRFGARFRSAGNDAWRSLEH